MKLPILGWTIDERFMTHRLRSTSIGGMAAVMVAAIMFFVHLFSDHVIHWELFAVVATAAVVKVAMMLWFRFKD